MADYIVAKTKGTITLTGFRAFFVPTEITQGQGWPESETFHQRFVARVMPD